MQAVKDMLADLNEMLAADARGEHTQEDFDQFMEKHGELFPDKPRISRSWSTRSPAARPRRSACWRR